MLTRTHRQTDRQTDTRTRVTQVNKNKTHTVNAYVRTYVEAFLTSRSGATSKLCLSVCSFVSDWEELKEEEKSPRFLCVFVLHIFFL